MANPFKENINRLMNQLIDKIKKSFDPPVNMCSCYPENSDYPTYCSVHDGPYSEWKFGRNGEDWDE